MIMVTGIAWRGQLDPLAGGLGPDPPGQISDRDRPDPLDNYIARYSPSCPGVRSRGQLYCFHAGLRR